MSERRRALIVGVIGLAAVGGIAAYELLRKPKTQPTPASQVSTPVTASPSAVHAPTPSQFTVIPTQLPTVPHTPIASLPITAVPFPTPTPSPSLPFRDVSLVNDCDLGAYSNGDYFFIFDQSDTGFTGWAEIIDATDMALSAQANYELSGEPCVNISRWACAHPASNGKFWRLVGLIYPAPTNSLTTLNEYYGCKVPLPTPTPTPTPSPTPTPIPTPTPSPPPLIGSCPTGTTATSTLTCKNCIAQSGSTCCCCNGMAMSMPTSQCHTRCLATYGDWCCCEIILYP